MMICSKLLMPAMAIVICLFTATLPISGADFPVYRIYGSNNLLYASSRGSELTGESGLATTMTTEEQLIAEIISQFSEQEIYQSVLDLQNLQTRRYGTAGNTAAGTYLYNRFDSIAGLTVEYQGGDLRNVIVTLPGLDSSSSEIYFAGAHYDSYSPDPNNAPGATDNAAGVAIVLEFARIMSQYQFNHTLRFACWNREEAGCIGSLDYVAYASSIGLDIPLYVNLDSSAYDPDNRFILDIMYRDTWVASMFTEHNSLYGIDFALTYNVHSGCASDHISFWHYGYTAMMTHEETHGPAHTPQDTIDKVSTLYAKRNGQLCMSVLTRMAEAMDVEAHDVEVSSVKPSKTVAAKGLPLSINVTLRNNGDFHETFTVTTTTNAQTLDQRQISLVAHTSTTFVFPWNTASLPYGAYIIASQTSSVPNETDLSDNTLTSEPVTITISGDIDGDFTVNIFDVVKASIAYGSRPMNRHWNPNADLDNDGDVDIFDVVAVASHYGESS